MHEIEHRIGGKPVGGDRSRRRLQPGTGEVVARVPLASAEVVDDAVRAAASAFESWRNVSVAKRQRHHVLAARAAGARTDDLARLITTEHGKTFDDARGEVGRGIEVVEYACGLPELLKGEHSLNVATDVDIHSMRQPLGVCAGITPFNFPVMVPMWMAPMAIATGNTFILKPSERDPSASLLLADLFAEAGIPEGVFNVVHGDKVAVDALLTHPGRRRHQLRGLDADREVRLRDGRGPRQARAGTGRSEEPHGGHARRRHGRCRRRADLGGLRLGRRAVHGHLGRGVGGRRRGRVHPARRAAPRVSAGGQRHGGRHRHGAAHHPEHRDRVSGYVDRGVEAGATPVVDGRELSVEGEGFFLGPTLFDGVEPEMDIYRDEIFGPVLAVVRVPSLEQALELVNANPYGNGAAIFTESGIAANIFSAQVTAGMVGVNVPIPVPLSFYSFGGWKNSLFGDRHIYGPEAIDFYTRGKVVTSRWRCRAGAAGHGVLDRLVAYGDGVSTAGRSPG